MELQSWRGQKRRTDLVVVHNPQLVPTSVAISSCRGPVRTQAVLHNLVQLAVPER